MEPTPIDKGPVLNWLPLLLQTADALFPTGGYAHSFGLEECVRLGLVRDEESLRTFFLEQVMPALEHFELPYLRFAYEAVLANDFSALATLDEEIGASKPARETRNASLRIGLRRLNALQNILPDEPRLVAFGRAVATGRLHGHHIAVCAVQGAVSGAPLDAVLATYFYQSVSAVAGASLKLMRIGQEGVQRALRAAAIDAASTVQRSQAIAREDAGWFNPLLEIAGMRHEGAHERLFIS